LGKISSIDIQAQNGIKSSFIQIKKIRKTAKKQQKIKKIKA